MRENGRWLEAEAAYLWVAYQVSHATGRRHRVALECLSNARRALDFGALYTARFLLDEAVRTVEQTDVWNGVIGET